MMMTKEFERGVLFVATGKKYINAAIRAASAVKENCPGLPIAFFGDWQNHGFAFQVTPYPFDIVEKIDNPHRRSKVDYLFQTPFDKTLYLDTDTNVVEDISGIFELLERFDVAVGHAMRRNSANRLTSWRTKLPKAFPQFNSGVFLYKNTPAVLNFLQKWSDAFHSAGFEQDQVALRELLWLSELRLTVLPPEYNVRYEKYRWFWSKTEAVPKIFHLQKYHDNMIKVHTKALLRNLFAKLGIIKPPKRNKPI